MVLTVKCSCDRQLRLDDALAGKHIRCPSCNGVLRVPEKAHLRHQTANTSSERQQLAPNSRPKAQHSPPPKRKRRQSTAPAERITDDGYDPYDGNTPLPPRGAATRGKPGKSSSFNISPIVAVLSVVLLLGGLGFGVWKLVQLVPEDFGKSKSLLAYPRGQYGPFTLSIPENALKKREEQLPLKLDGLIDAQELHQTWVLNGTTFNVYYYEFNRQNLSLLTTTYKTSTLNKHLNATSHTTIVETWCDMVIPGKVETGRYKWAPAVELQVAGITSATMMGVFEPNKRNWAVGEDIPECKVFCCRINDCQIVISRGILPGRRADALDEFDQLMHSLKYNANESAEN